MKTGSKEGPSIKLQLARRGKLIVFQETTTTTTNYPSRTTTTITTPNLGATKKEISVASKRGSIQVIVLFASNLIS